MFMLFCLYIFSAIGITRLMKVDRMPNIYKIKKIIITKCSIIMSYNELEELAKEYHEYIKEYFTRTNVRFNKLDNGLYEGEIDVLSFDPKEKKLINLECSM